jgi:23S rRNA (uracil1939-C5)-methyltransferase
MKKLSIERLGSRGEGIATGDGQRIFVPYALAGETVHAEIEGDHARLVEIIVPSPDRIAPMCRHFGDCGGCAVQNLRYDAYAAWKRSLVETALRNAGLDVPVGQLADAHGAGRRRVTFHARFTQDETRVGFMAARSHRLIEIDACPLLTAELAPALAAARILAAALATRGKPLDLAITATPAGLDIDLRGSGPLTDAERTALVEAAKTLDLARLTNHGRLLTLGSAPNVDVGGVRTPLPPGAFLQATHAGEEALTRHVLAAAKGTKNVADLFCGVGAFALPLARFAAVAAYDNNAPAIAALKTAAHGASGLRPVRAECRDLYERPLMAQELAAFDAVVFDPPRAGASAQSTELAKSDVPLVIAVSCNAQSFCRDAAILRDGGYLTEEIIPIDQFRFSPHLELVAVFRRKREGKNRRRRLLG